MLTYQADASHQFAKCIPQPNRCGPGQRLGATKVGVALCVTCPTLTFQTALNHQLTNCTASLAAEDTKKVAVEVRVTPTPVAESLQVKQPSSGPNDALAKQRAAQSAVAQSAVACGKGRYWNVDAFEGTGGCFPCAAGTYHALAETLMIGDSNFKCPESCPSGSTSLPGAASLASCFSAYVAMGPIANLGYAFHESVAPHSCGGSSNVPTDPSNAWPNRGYSYVRDATECLLAATTLARDAGARHALEPPANMPGAQTECAVSRGAAAPASPPQGVCGYMHHPTSAAPTATNVSEILVFAEHAEPQCFPNMQFTALCRLVFCNHLQQIRGSGAASPPGANPPDTAPTGRRARWREGGNRPTAKDDATCEANPTQLSLWQKDESSKYTSFYTVAGVTTGMATMAMFAHVIHTDKAAGERGNRVYQFV